MVKNVIFFIVGVFLFISKLDAQESSEPPDWGNDCNLRGGAIGRFVHPEECEDDVEIVSRFGPPSKPIMSGNLICCRKHPPHIAKFVCNKLVESRQGGVTPQILGGTSVQEGEFPHMALIGYQTPGVPPILNFTCGGTLISDQFVLTAAHCVYNKNQLLPYLVRLGTLLKYPTEEETKLTDYLVAENIVHPKYDRIKKYNDIALLRLARRVEKFTQTIFPACIDYEKMDPTTVMSIAGWGNHIKDDKISTSDVMLKAYVQVEAANDCTQFYNKSQWAKNFPDGIPSYQICAKGAENNTDADTCPGDSGGPLQLQVEKSTISRVIGVTSFGSTCGYNKPGIYSRVSSFLDWITQTVWPGEDHRSFAVKLAKDLN